MGTVSASAERIWGRDRSWIQASSCSVCCSKVHAASTDPQPKSIKRITKIKGISGVSFLKALPRWNQIHPSAVKEDKLHPANAHFSTGDRSEHGVTWRTRMIQNLRGDILNTRNSRRSGRLLSSFLHKDTPPLTKGDPRHADSSWRAGHPWWQICRPTVIDNAYQGGPQTLLRGRL